MEIFKTYMEEDANTLMRHGTALAHLSENELYLKLFITNGGGW